MATYLVLLVYAIQLYLYKGLFNSGTVFVIVFIFYWLFWVIFLLSLIESFVEMILFEIEFSPK